MTSQITSIHASRQPRRPHFIAEWMERRRLTAAELSREIGASESVISRWLHGGSPGAEWQQKLGALFGCGPDGIFRHPDEDWLKRFFEGRKADEIARIKATLEAAFPKASNGD